MAKKTKTNTILLVALIGVVVFGSGAGLYMLSQQTALEQEKAGEQITGVPVAVHGKAATARLYAKDQAANSPSTSNVEGLLYLITDPELSSDKGGPGADGDFVADGTSMTTSSRTSVTGFRAGQTYAAIAANNSYYGKWSEPRLMVGEEDTMNLEVWKVTTGGNLELYDKNENQILKGTRNLTLGADETEAFDKIRIENNVTNSGWNVMGIYFNLVAETNITDVSGSGTTEKSYSVGYSETGSLRRTQNDDVVFELDEATMLLEYELIDLTQIQILADAEGCSTGEDVSISVYDANWYRSAKENLMKFGPETDASSAVDTGRSDVTDTYSCTA